MEYLHSMIRVTNIETSLDFYCAKLGMKEIRRYESVVGRFTNIFLVAPGDEKRAGEAGAPLLELTYNWPPTDDSAPEVYTGGRNFGHLAFSVEDVYDTCQRLHDAGVIIARPPRDGRMAFIVSPDGISIELLQRGEALSPQAPWDTMENTGTW